MNNTTYQSTIYQSPVGPLTLASEGDKLVGLWLEESRFRDEKFFRAANGQEDAPVLPAAKNWLDRYFAGGKPAISELPLAPSGGAFRQLVWALLCEIPYGQVTTYGALAKKVAAMMGKERMASQAVGGAVGHNPISIIIPCHRVIGVNGNLTGYGGGLHNKIKLLEHEGIDVPGLRDKI